MRNDPPGGGGLLRAVLLLGCACTLVSGQSNKLNVWAAGGDYTVSGGAVTNVADCDTDLFPNKLTVSHASFGVTYKNFYKVVENRISNDKYVLLQRGCESKALEAADVNLTVITVPARQVLISSSTRMAAIAYMGERKSIKGANGLYTNSPCLHKQAADGHTKEYGGSWSSIPLAYNATSMKYEIAGMSQDWSIDVAFNRPMSEPKAVQISDTAEPTYKKIAEWYEYVSLFYNREREMEDHDEEVRQRWDCHSNKVANMSPKKKILWASVSSSDYTYSVWPCYHNYGGGSVKTAGYRYCDLMQAAGGTVMNFDTSVLDTAGYTRSTMSWSNGTYTGISRADFITFASSADVIVFHSGCPFGGSTSDCENFFRYHVHCLSDIKAVQDGNVYHSAGIPVANGGTDWYTNLPFEPDVNLEDIIEMMYPDAIEHTMKYYAKLQYNTVGGIPGTTVQCATVNAENCAPTAAQQASLCVDHGNYVPSADACSASSNGTTAMMMTTPAPTNVALSGSVCSVWPVPPTPAPTTAAPTTAAPSTAAPSTAAPPTTAAPPANSGTISRFASVSWHLAMFLPLLVLMGPVMIA